MNRYHFLAAEIFSYSYANYDDHLGTNPRFDKYMPDDAKTLERAEKESWTDARVAQALKVKIEEVSEWRKCYRDAIEIVDAKNPAESFRNSIRQSLAHMFRRHPLGDSELEDAVTQICYRTSDLAFLLDQRKEALSKYSEDLRKEGDEEEHLGD